jgi:hypothetical protein
MNIAILGIGYMAATLATGQLRSGRTVAFGMTGNPAPAIPPPGEALRSVPWHDMRSIARVAVISAMGSPKTRTKSACMPGSMAPRARRPKHRVARVREVPRQD